MSGYFFHRYFCFHNFKNTQFLILRSAPRRELFFSIERIEPLLALKESNPPNKSALTEQINALKASKIPKNEANIEKIKNLLLKILRDIKTEMAEQQLLGPVATAEAVDGIRAALPDKPDSELTLQDMTTAITSFVGTQIPLNSEMAKQIEQLTTALLQSASENSAIE